MDHDETAKTEPIVIQEEACAWEGWDDSTGGGVRWRTLLSADRTPSQGLTCGVAEIAVQGRIDKADTHHHAQAEVYYFLSGEGVVTIDGHEYPVRTGSTVFIPCDAGHGVWNTGREPLRLFYVFAVDSFDEVEYVFHKPGPESIG